MDRLTTRSSASTRWSAWKAPRRPALRQPALPRKGAEVLRAGHGTRDRKALATWPMGEEVRFRDRAGPIALDIVAEVIFGVADNPRAERVRARAIAWLDTSRSTRRVIQTAWGDKPRRPLDPKLRPDHRLAAGGRGPGARGDRRAPPHERATQTHSTATDYRSLRRRARSRSMTTRGCVRTLRATSFPASCGSRRPSGSGRASLRHRRRILFAQHRFEDLAGRVAGDGLGEDHLLGQLVACEPGSAVLTICCSLTSFWSATTMAAAISPHFSSGKPMTATSLTPGTPMITLSISAG